MTEINEEADSQADVDDFAKLWLREAVRDFTPRDIVGIRPDAKPRDAVKSLYSDKLYLVKTVSKGSNGVANLTVVYYNPLIGDWGTF